MLKRMATKIQQRYRGHLGRRRYRTFHNLRRIQNAHALVLGQALRRNSFGNKVFWYKRPAELRLLYLDYKELVDRTGNRPPLYKVEDNIQEIRDRVHTIECEYATKIQAHFRGLLGRRFIIKYRFAVAKWMEGRVNASFIIQRVYRAWRDCQRFKTLKQARKLNDITAKYKEERRLKKEAETLSHADQKAMSYYKRGWRQGQAALYTGLVAFGEHKGKKYIAHRESTYYKKGDTSIEALMKSNMELKHAVKAAAIEKEKEKEERAAFVHKRRERHQMTAKYFEEEHLVRRKEFKKRIFVGEDKVCLFSGAQNHRKVRAPGVELLRKFALDSDEDLMPPSPLHSLKSTKPWRA